MSDDTKLVPLVQAVGDVADDSETWERLWWCLGSLVRERLAPRPTLGADHGGGGGG